MKKIVLFVLLGLSVILGCTQPSQNLYTVDNINFDFEKWYASADTIKANCNFPIITWEDDVFNPENQEFLLEVCFDNNIYPDNVDPVELQYLFVERYSGTCHAVTEGWYIWYTDYKGVH